MSSGFTHGWVYCRKNLVIKNEWVRKGISEFLGSCILMIFTNGAAIQHFIHIREDNRQPMMAATLSSILGIMIAIIVSGAASGAHINPAVSVGFASAGLLSWLKVPWYILCQFLGGFLGSGIAYLVNSAKLQKLAGDLTLPEAFPPTFLAPLPRDVSIWTGIADQALSTCIMMGSIIAMIDPHNMKIPHSMIPLTVGLVVMSVSITFNSNAGAVLNPMRDLVPRIFAMTIGYTAEESMQNDYYGEKQHWWIVGQVGPYFGAVLGVLVYLLGIGAHLPEKKPDNDSPDPETKTKNEGGQAERSPSHTTSPQIHPSDESSKESGLHGQLNGGFRDGD